MLDECSLSTAALIERIKIVTQEKASFSFQAKGHSMSPFIKDNDLLTVSPVSSSAISLGKTVAFVLPQTGDLAVHRIVGIKGDYCLIKGDNTKGTDGLIPKEHILGCVTRIKRNNKNVFLGLGPERRIIAFASKIRLLSLIFCAWRLIPFSVRRFTVKRIIA